MKALQYLGPKQLEFAEVPEPEIGENDILLKIRKVGICGTDLHIYSGGMKVPTPLIMGHEFVGDIVKVGKKVSGLKVGMRAVAEHVIGCKECSYCQDGHKNICDNATVIGLHRPGALAEYLSLPAELVYELPDELSYDDGVLVEPISIAVYGVRRTHVDLGDAVAVVGQGPIGLFIDQVAKAAGALVFGIDVNDGRLEFAQKQKIVDGIINSTKGDLLKHFNQLAQKCGADVVFEAVGREETAQAALELVKPEGKVLVQGVFEHDVKLNLMHIVKKEITLMGSWTCLNAFEPTIDLIKAKKIKTDGFITHRYAFKDAPRAFEDSLSYSDGRIKSVIEF